MNIIHTKYTMDGMEGDEQCFIVQDETTNLSVAFVLASGAPIGTPMRYWVNVGLYKGIKSAIHFDTDEADYLGVSREGLTFEEVQYEEQIIAIAQEMVLEHLNAVSV